MAPSNSSNFLVIEDPYFKVSKEVRRIKAGAQALSLYGNMRWTTRGVVAEFRRKPGLRPEGGVVYHRGQASNAESNVWVLFPSCITIAGEFS